MRFLTTQLTPCSKHPDDPKEGDPNGDIRCLRCGTLLGRWDAPWQPRWAIAFEDFMGRCVAAVLPRSVVKWTIVRATSHAMQPLRGDLVAPCIATMTARELSKRWEAAPAAPAAPS